MVALNAAFSRLLREGHALALKDLSPLLAGERAVIPMLGLERVAREVPRLSEYVDAAAADRAGATNGAARESESGAMRSEAQRASSAATQADPLAGFDAFTRGVRRRLAVEREEYRDESFDWDPAELLGEVGHVCGWAYVTWCRVQRLAQKADEAQRRLAIALEGTGR